MALVVLDAGHGGANPGAVYSGRQEKDDVLALTLAIGQILEERGIDVYYTRTTDVYETPLRKAQEGNQMGADYFVSIHRNSSPYPNQYTGVLNDPPKMVHRSTKLYPLPANQRALLL